MQRYVIRMFADDWKQWVPAIAVVAVMATMIGLCVHQFAWTSGSRFRAAAGAAGVPATEFQILSVTIYVVVALISWVALTVVGRASIHATHRTYALLLMLGASPAAVFGSTILLLSIVSLCGALLGALVSAVLSFWVVPAFNAMISPTARLPEYTLAAWAPVVAIVMSVLTALVGGFPPAFHASRVRPGAVLRPPDGLGRESASGLRIVCGAFFLIVASGLVASAGFAGPLGVTGPGPMFNLAVTAGGSALMAVHLLCPQLMRLIFWALNGLFSRMGLVVPALGTRSATSRVGTSATTVAPLAVGLGGIGLLLCAVNSVIAFTDALQPGLGQT